jgi:hypothetical protein
MRFMSRRNVTIQEKPQSPMHERGKNCISGTSRISFAHPTASESDLRERRLNWEIKKDIKNAHARNALRSAAFEI